MAVTLEDVRAVLSPDEPQYAAAASTLGPDALPHLATLAAGDNLMLATKAVYLASLIDPFDQTGTVQTSASSSEVVVRVAAAGAAGNLHPDVANPVLTSLLDDRDVGIRKVALRSVPANPSRDLLAKVAELSTDQSTHQAVRALSQEIVDRS